MNMSMHSRLRLLMIPILVAATLLAACTQSAPPPPLPPLEGVEPQVAAAVRSAHDALANDTGSGELWGRYAMTLDVHDLAEPALQAYAKACELQPREFRWWYYRAERTARTNPEAAVPMFAKARELNPDYAAQYVRYGRALEQLGQFDDALALFKRGVELDPNCALAYAGIGRIGLGAGQVDQARQALEKAIEIDPQCGVALSSLAQVYERLGQPEQALAMTERADAAPRQGQLNDPIMSELEALGVSTGQVINRAQSYAQAGSPQQAVDALAALTRTNPSRADAHIAKGQHELQLSRFDAAIESFREAIRIDPESVTARLGLADALRFARRNEEAIAAYREVIERDGQIGEAYRGLGTCLLLLEQLDAALPQFRKAAALLPEDNSVHIALARLEFLKFNDKAVIDALAPILAARDSSARADRMTIDALNYTGLAHLRAGNEEIGRQFIDDALKAGADITAVARDLGEIGRAEMAVELLRGALARNPNDANAQMALAYELATTPQDEVRNSDEAMQLIDALLQRNVGGFRAQEIRAFALADKGFFNEAVQTMEQALAAARAGAPALVLQQFERRIEQFKRHEKYRHELIVPTERQP